MPPKRSSPVRDNRPPSLALAALVSLALGLPTACATPTAASADPDHAEARTCLATAHWLDRVEGDSAVVVDPEGASRVVPLADLPRGAAPGVALLPAAEGSRCGALVRAYLRALRASRAKPWDSRVPVRL